MKTKNTPQYGCSNLRGKVVEAQGAKTTSVMRTLVRTVFIASMLLILLKNAYAQHLAIEPTNSTTHYKGFMFSARLGPGNLFGYTPYGALFGYKIGKWAPFGGIQYLKGSFTDIHSGTRYDYQTGQIVNYKDVSKYSAGVYMPFTGVKYFMIEKQDVKAYLISIIAKPFVSGKIVEDGVKNEDFEEDIKNISLWGFQNGFGSEYFISNNFSFGAEFGIRFFLFKQKHTEDDYPVYDPNTGETLNTTRTYEHKVNVSWTYTTFSVNYYF